MKALLKYVRDCVDGHCDFDRDMYEALIVDEIRYRVLLFGDGSGEIPAGVIDCIGPHLRTCWDHDVGKWAVIDEDGTESDNVKWADTESGLYCVMVSDEDGNIGITPDGQEIMTDVLKGKIRFERRNEVIAE